MVKGRGKEINTNNFMELINKICDSNYKINFNFIKEIAFEDKKVEEKFQEFFLTNTIKFKYFCDVSLIIVYIVFFIFAINVEIFFIRMTIIICFLLSITTMIMSYCSKKIKHIYYLDHGSNFFYMINILTQGIIIFFFKEPNFDALNIMILFFQITLIYFNVIFKTESNLYVFSFYNLIGVGYILFFFFYYAMAKDALYFLGLTFLNFYFVVIRKFFDYLMRSIFFERLQFENLYNYTFEFIRGLNCNKILMKNNEFIIVDNKIIIQNKIKKEDSQNESQIELRPRNLNEFQILFKKDDEINNKLIEDLIPYDNNLDIKESQQEILILNNQEENYLERLKEASKVNLNLKDFLNKLIFEKKDECSNDLILKKSNFEKLGIYHLKIKKKYFEIYVRFISIIKGDTFYDLLFFDVSEVIISKIIINNEYIIKQKFLAKIAHEFKTPINSIIGLISQIKEENEIINNNKPLNSNTELDLINNLSEYVNILVSDIIEYSRVQDGIKIVPNLRRVKIKTISSFCFGILKCLLDCNHNKKERIKPLLVCDLYLLEQNVSIDETRTKQIILNFISNSVKFTKSGEIVFSLKIENNNKTLRLTVSDTGIGIREEDRNKIFNDFMMLEEERQNNIQGSGLGLSICKNIAEKLSMKIGFDSTYRRGSNFYILIPVDIPLQENNNKNNVEIISFPEEVKENNTENIPNIPEEIKDDEKTEIETDSQFKNKEEEFYKIRQQIGDSITEISDIYLDHLIKNLPKEKEENEKGSSPKNSKKSPEENSEILDYKENSFIYSDNSDASKEENSILCSPKKNEKLKSDIFEEIKENSNVTFKTKQGNEIENKNEIENPSLGKILIVDDSLPIAASNRFVINRALTKLKLNFELIVLYDGVDIIKHIIEDQKNGNKIKCILTDENMEYINGSLAVKILRDLEKKDIIMNFKVISVSSDNSIDKKDYLKSIGMDETLEKPLSEELVIEKFQELGIIDIDD